MTNELKFKVGDKVLVNGDQGTIIEVDATPYHIPYKVSYPFIGVGWFHEHALTPVEPEAQPELKFKVWDIVRTPAGIGKIVEVSYESNTATPYKVRTETGLYWYEENAVKAQPYTPKFKVGDAVNLVVDNIKSPGIVKSRSHAGITYLYELEFTRPSWIKFGVYAEYLLELAAPEQALQLPESDEYVIAQVDDSEETAALLKEKDERITALEADNSLTALLLKEKDGRFTALESENASQKHEIATYRAENARLNIQQRTLLDANNEQQQKIAALEEQLSAADSAIETLDDEVANAKAEIEQLKHERAQLFDKLEQMDQKLNRLIARTN